MLISCMKNKILGISYQSKTNLNRSSQVTNGQKVKNINQREKNTIFFKFCKLQQKVHQKFFEKSRTTHEFDKQKQTVNMNQKKTTSI